ncbi:MAG: serine/threonine-protein kinase [Pseudomonadota bacterium]
MSPPTETTEMNEDHQSLRHRFCPACFEAHEGGVEICPDDGTALVQLQHHEGPLTGRMIDGKYKVVALLGQGGMGEVYRARQLPMNQEVALKVLYEQFLRTPQDVKRFVREASAASRMKSRYAVMVHDFGIASEGFIYLAMELAEGDLLSEHLQGSVPLDVERALHLAIDVCHALEDAHGNGIVHRDLKPGNIMLNVEDGHEIARVLDFGTARFVDRLDDDRITEEGKVFGTPEYMCPEQAMGDDVDGWADLYSLGIILYEMLTGQLPFTGKSHTAVLLNHINRKARPMAEVAPDVQLPLPLVHMVEQLMAKRGKDRPASARVVRLELEGILLDLAGEPPESHKRRFRTTTSAKVHDLEDVPSPQPGLGLRTRLVLGIVGAAVLAAGALALARLL